MQTQFCIFSLERVNWIRVECRQYTGLLNHHVEVSLSCKLFMIEIKLLLLLTACKRNLLATSGQTHVQTCPSLMIIQSVRWGRQFQTDLNYMHPNSQQVDIAPVISPVLHFPWPLALLSVCCVTGISFPVAPESLPVVLWFCSWWTVPQVPTRHTWTFVQVSLSFRLFWTCCFRLVTDLMRTPTYHCSYLLLACYEPCLQVFSNRVI